jgi:hypothetical protein
MGFTRSESLVVVLADGHYRLYPLGSTQYSTHTLGNEAAETGVLDARIYPGGMVVLLGSLAFAEVRGWGEDGDLGGKVEKMPEPSKGEEDCFTRCISLTGNGIWAGRFDRGTHLLVRYSVRGKRKSINRGLGLPRRHCTQYRSCRLSRPGPCLQYRISGTSPLNRLLPPAYLSRPVYTLGSLA